MSTSTAQRPTLWSDDSPATLLASHNQSTGEWHFPVLPEHSPLAAHHTTMPVTGTGTVYSYTVIHPSPKSGLTPYALGYVDFDGKLRIFGRLQGTARPAIGDRYVAQRDDTYGYVFQAVQD